LFTRQLCTAPDEGHELEIVQRPDSLAPSGFHVVCSLQLPGELKVPIEESQRSTHDVPFLQDLRLEQGAQEEEEGQLVAGASATLPATFASWPG